MAGHGRRSQKALLTDVLMVTTTVGMLDWVHSNTTSLKRNERIVQVYIHGEGSLKGDSPKIKRALLVY